MNRHPSTATTAILIRDCVDDLRDRSPLEPLAPAYEKALRAIHARVHNHMTRGGIATDSSVLWEVLETSAKALRGRL